MRHRGEMGTVRSRKTIVASGAYERAAAFPGWDLPGVMTPGGAQTLVKSQRVLPGSRIVLAGSGPFLLPVATTLIEAGAKIVGIFEATTPREWARHAPRLWGHWERLREGLRYKRAIATAGVPIRYGHIVVRAEGAECVERVVLAKCDAQRPRDSRHRARRGSRHALRELRLRARRCSSRARSAASIATRRAWGGWIPVHSEDMETSVAGVFVAGEVAGIGGAHAAMAEGTLAGLIAARQLGRDVSDARLAQARADRTRHRAFARLVSRRLRDQARRLRGDHR